MLSESGFDIIKQLFKSFLGMLTILVYHFIKRVMPKSLLPPS